MPQTNDEQLDGPESAADPKTQIDALRTKYNELSVADAPEEQRLKYKQEVETLLKGAEQLIRDMGSVPADALATPSNFAFNSAKVLNNGPNKERLAQQLDSGVLEEDEYRTTYNSSAVFHTAREIASENDLTPENAMQWANLAYGSLDIYELAAKGENTRPIPSEAINELLPDTK